MTGYTVGPGHERMGGSMMHDDEIPIDRDLVRDLIDIQFPQWSELPLRRVPSIGTDNALFRLGHDMVVRLPRIEGVYAQVEKEHQWLPKLAPHLAVTIPEPLALGKPSDEYPWIWAVHTWCEGENLTIDALPDGQTAAREIAEFIKCLRAMGADGGPTPGKKKTSRGQPLHLRDDTTREAIQSLENEIDTTVALRAWREALDAKPWIGKPVWFHGDMLPGNLLFKNGHLSAVIDFASLAVGDPTCDLMIAWNLFTRENRAVFRSVLAVDDDTWLRGRGWALSQAAIYIPYYRNTNPGGVAQARTAIKEVLDES